MSIKQSATSKKGRRTTPIGDSRGTMAKHQYQYDRATTEGQTEWMP